ncbi:MAG: hypothetical protein ACWGOX_07785, partial [Desulforhopalus sp.]
MRNLLKGLSIATITDSALHNEKEKYLPLFHFAAFKQFTFQLLCKNSVRLTKYRFINQHLTQSPVLVFWHDSFSRTRQPLMTFCEMAAKELFPHEEHQAA